MAYPILYKANETNFEHLGVSVLSDASKCYVSREKNGIYILEFDYPVNGKDVDKIKEGMYIKSDAGYRTKNQRFVISKITKTQNEFKIYCQHISQVKTTMNAIRPDITVTSVSAIGALRAWRDNLLDSREEFFVQSDIGTLNSTTWKVENIENARDALGGKAGSILDVWGGEYEFDNLNITLHKSMGIDNPTIIAYGKNLLDLEQEQSILETYTSVFPFKKYTDDNNREQLITLPEILLDSTHLNKFTHRRILKIDFSNDENLKTVEQLRSKAKSYIKSNNVGVPKTNLKINYQDLSKVEGVFDNPALEQIDLCDKLKVYYNELGILNENAKVVKVIWNVILEENHEIEVGDGRSSFTDSTSAKLESLQVQNDSVLARINALVAEQEAAFDRFFKEKSKVIEDKVKGGYEKALLSSEEKIRKMGEAFDEKINQFREQVSTAVENYNRQFQATNLEISKNRVEATKQIQAVNLEISKSRIEATKQIQALSDRVNNMQDISNNETVVELRGLVNGATSKVTELETSITREFTAVKKKNEDRLSAVKAEFTKGVDGLVSKVSSLEEYRNQDGTRTESLKQWVQRDTANQLSRERTEINRIVDAKGYVKNTEFSSKFNDNAQGINRKLEVLETYKNQDGTRTSALKQWTQENTASQLSTARRGIENWVDGKGYATTTIVENKVQETANSISREIRNIRESIPTSVGGRNYIVDSDKLTNINSGGTNWEKTVENGTLVFTKVRATESTGIWTQIMPFLKDNFQNEVLTWSLDVKASKNISFNNVGQETNGFKGRVDLTTNWQRISHTFTNRYTQHYAFLFYQMLGTCSPGDKVYVRLPKLEIGSVATDWTPAPEDNNAFVKNTEFSNKFNENAQGINRQLTALEQYKNQEGVRTNSLKQWTQENTASQLNSTRQGIERWVDNKGYATTSVVNNKVQEATNSFSREISNVRNSIPTSIGGRNYISNSNFAKDMENWELPRLNNSGLNWQKGHAIYHFGRGLHIWGTPNGEYKGLGTIPFSLTAKQGEKITVSMDLGKDALTAHSILFIGLHYIVDNDIVSQQWQTLDLATQNFEVKKYKRISKTFTVTADMNKCRLMIHTKANQLINFYIDNIKLEKGDIATDWTPAPEDVEQNVNELNTWKQTATGTLNTVTNTLNDTVRHSQLRVGADKIDFGSNQVFDGRNLASMLSVSPESIQAISDRVIISPSNENLVKREYRDTFILNVRNGVLNRIYGSNADLVGEYQFKVAIIDFDTPTLNASIHVKYKDGTDSWFNSEFPTPSIVTLETSTSVKVQVELRKEIEYIEPLVFQNKWSDFYRFHLKKLFVGKKKSAELIVDGSIEGRHIKTETLETGHHKAGSITSEIIAANAVRAKHVLIDDGLINNLVTHNAFISKLWAQDAFIKNLQTVKIKSTQIDADLLSAYTGKIGMFSIGGNKHTGSGKWITGENSFQVGMSDGSNGATGAAFWANWGNKWDVQGPNSWFVMNNGAMQVNNRANINALYVYGDSYFTRRLRAQGAGVDVGGTDVYGVASGRETRVIWWSQINDVKSSISDERLKTNVKPTKINALETLNNIKMVEFNWIKDGEFEKIGAIAQQVQSVDESLVCNDTSDKNNPTDYLRISYYNCIPYLIKAVQELSEENKILKQQIGGINKWMTNYNQ
nr:MAG TPA: tail protein [Caudoviricetes sp.]